MVKETKSKVTKRSLILALVSLLLFPSLLTFHSSPFFAQLPTNTPAYPVNAQWVTDKGSQVYNVKAFGATGNGTTDDTAAITTAVAAAAAVYGKVYFPSGMYLVSSPGIPFETGVAYEGENGRTGGHSAAKVISYTSDVFYAPGSTNIFNPIIRNLSITSGAGGGHVLNLIGPSGATVAGLLVEDSELTQNNTGKSIVYSAGGNNLGDYFQNVSATYASNTVPAFWFTGSTINTLSFKNMVVTGSANSSNYAFYLDSTGSGTLLEQVSFKDIVFEVATGGAIYIGGGAQVLISTSGVYDTSSPVNPLFNVAISSGGLAGAGTTFLDSYSAVSGTTSTIPDLAITSGINGTTLIQSHFGQVAGIGGIPRVVNIRSDTGTTTNLSQVNVNDLGIEFDTTATGYNNFAFVAGGPGYYGNVLMIQVGGVTKGQVNGNGSFQWGSAVIDAAGDGALTTLTVGGGTTITTMNLYSTASITPTAVSAASCSDQTFAVTGLLTSDRVSAVTPPSALGNVSLNAYASAAGTVLLHFCNPSSSSVTPPAGVYSFLAVH